MDTMYPPRARWSYNTTSAEDAPDARGMAPDGVVIAHFICQVVMCGMSIAV